MSTLQERGRLARAQSEALLGRSLRTFDPSEPRDEAGRWTGGGDEGPTAFVSPNVSTLTFEQAVAALDSKQQANLTAVGSFIDSKLGISSSNYPAIGAWSDGAENSMMVRAPGASTAQMRAASAMKGYLADQKAVLIFHPSDSEESDEHLLHFDVSSDATKLHEKLLSDGLAFHTLQPLGEDHYRVHVYASDQATIDAVAKSAKGFKADVTAIPGKGEFLGTSKDTGSDREQRDDARRIYDKTIKEIAASGELQGLARTWDDVRDHWRSITAEAKGIISRFDPSEPRDESGKWTDGGGSGDAGEESGKHPGEGYSKHAYIDKHGVIQTTKVRDAQLALSENRKVNLDQPKKVSTLIQRLAKEARKMIEKGKEAPNFNLCNVSVADTNLFCSESKGIPRAKMPQLDEDQTNALVEHLKSQGYEVTKEREFASHLRATQDELSSAKVAKITEKAKKNPEKLEKRLVISKDDYILDGHHHWATKLGFDAADGKLTNDTKMRISRVNIGIVQLLKEAEKFSGPHKTASDKALEVVTMAIKPGKGESQSDWMSRCVPDMMGQGGGTKRPQEQAVAACMTMWRDKDKAALQTRLAPEPPEEDEPREDYMERCLDELGDEDEDEAERLCELTWDRYTEEKAARGLKHKTHAAPVVGMEFVLSDETVDRMGEIVASDGWNTESFNNNPIALFGHRSDFPIGTWSNLRVENKALRGHLKLAPEGTSERIDEIRRLIDAKILKAVSVGFRPIKSEPLNPEDRGMFAPQRYIQQELVECSLVSVPANPNALAVVKALNISPATVDLIFAKHGNQDQVRRLGLIGKHAITSHTTRRGKDIMSSLTQRIIDVETKLVDLKDQLSAHWMKTDETDVSDADLEVSSGLNAEIAQLEKQHTALIESEKLLAKTVDGNNGHVSRSRALSTTTAFAQESTIESGIERMRIAAEPKTKFDLLDCLVRAGTVAWAAKSRNQSLEEARQQIALESPRYNDEVTKFMCNLVLRAPSAPAMTTVTGWAAELVQQIYTAPLDLLFPKAIATRLAAKGLTLNFGRAGRIIIPMRSRTPTIAGSFVGEGQPIPVRQGAFTSQTLTPKKLAVITTFTKEMQDHSTPAIEGILRDAIQTDTTVAIDSILIDANAATTVRPAGLLNGVTVTTATAGGGLAAIIGDIKSLVSALVASTYGNVRSPVFLMNPGDMLAASLISAANTGIFPFRDEIARGTLNGIPIIDSATVPVKTMILIDAADYVVVGGEAPRIDMSDQATLHFEDTTPLDLVAGSPGTVAAPQKSLFQTDSIALRMIMPLNWVQRRTGTIAWTQSVSWA